MRILSLGCGVQSSTLALMMKHGEIEPADYAIFADTHGEPKVVYDYLKYLLDLIPFPIIITSAGNLEEDFFKALSDPNGRCGNPPFMSWSEEKKVGAPLWRKCTADYKIKAIRREVRKLKQKNNHIEQIIGISLDEAHRMKPSDVKYITHVYPLVDKRINRQDCINWTKKHGYKIPPKSACYYCPYIDTRRLRYMRDYQPNEWKRLVDFDYKMRAIQSETINGAKIKGTLYIHRSCKPIDEVDLSTPEDHGQFDMFGEECEGMCGL